MLNSFRQFSGGLTTKILLVLLIASFALWGMEGMVGGPRGSHTLATVGKKTISTDSFQRELTMETEQLRRQLGANYSKDLMQRMNVPQFVLKRMIQQSLLAQEAEAIDLLPDDTAVALNIRKNPVFLNQSGLFDKARFEAMLRSQGLSEHKYVEQLRLEMASDKLLDSLAVDLPITPAMLSHAQSAFNQGRTVALYQLNAANQSAAPSEEELSQFHREHAERFTAPEYRTVQFVRFTAREVASAVKPAGDQAIREYYQSHTQQFSTPEKREIEQLLYNQEEKAREAYAQVRAGKSFADVAKAVEPLNKGSLSLGALEKKAVMENAADAVFSLKAGQTTEPVKSPFGWHIFRVAGIRPAGTQPLEKVRKDIEEQLKQSAYENAISDKINELEDALASGGTLAEAASGMRLKVESAGIFDKEGRTPQGSSASLPELDKFIDVAFRTEEKTESSVISSKNGVYYVLRVENITPEKLRPLADIRTDVAKAYAQYRHERAVSDLASTIEEEIRNGKPAKDIIAAHRLTPAAIGTITRDSKTMNGSVLLPSFVADVFGAGIGSLTKPSRDREGGYAMAYVTGTTPAQEAQLSETDATARKKELLRSMQEEMMMQYLNYLQIKYPVSIHENVLNRLVEANDAAR